ncbi:hypothetical protein [Saccharothrix sp. ALI-22-I]|uniref:hypothetical protein n=1 Tax=Saccharothrix sp. ALI-22-I TaxID=1933778 RepID=UPI00097C4B1B|nr:hypothetical protein [Saccharothrix sp. ALI-22-I]
MSRTRFLLLLGVPALVVVLVLTVVLTGERDVPVADLPPTPTILATLRLEPRTPEAGEEVVVRATVSADRPITVRALTVQVVRNSTNESRDFPPLNEHSIGTTAQEITFRRTFDAPGEYTYLLAYRLDDDWVRLKPWQTFKVR